MIKINLICVGDIKEKYLKDAIDEYKKRISKFANLNIVEVKENAPKTNYANDIEQNLKKDAENILKFVKGYLIVLDPFGKQFSSVDFAKKIEKLALNHSEISFVIGASNGIHQSVKNLADEKISFSMLTFPHQLMRVIFLEQLYRAFTINNNISYHK